MSARSEGRLVALLMMSMVLTGPLAAPARGSDHEHHPRGWARLQGWAAQVERDDDDPRAGGALRSRIDLSEDVRLDLAYARTLEGRGEGEDFGYAQAAWRALRVGGGTVGDDHALHVGLAPRFAWDAARWLRLEGGLDVAMGVGWLGDRDDRGATRDDELAVWRDAGRGGIDVYAASTAGDLTLRLRPHAAVELSVGAYVDAFLAAGRPGLTDPLPEALDRLANDTDLGVAATLSQGSVGAHGGAGLRLLRHACDHGTETELWLRYREAWDWIHLDPVYTVLAETRPFDDVRFARVPWRTTRTLALEATRAFGEGGHVSATIDVRHVGGSTTVQDFADRDGWSTGARLAGRYGRVFGAAGVRWHLQDSPLEPLLGPMPRARVDAQVGVLLVADPQADVAIEAGFEHGRQDDWGVPRDGWAGWGAVTVTFGGARDLLERDLLDRALLVPPLPRRGPPATGRVAARDLWTPPTSTATATAAPALAAADVAAPQGALPEDPALDFVPPEYSDDAQRLGDVLGIDPGDVAGFEDEGRASGLLDGPVDLDEVDDFLDRAPTVAERLEQRLPGVRDLLGRVISVEDGRLSGQALLREEQAVLFSGYGPQEAGIGVAWRNRLTVSRTYALRGAAPEGEASPAARSEREDLLGEGLTFRSGSALDLAERRRWQKLTLAVPDGDRYRVVFQGSTGWTRAMRLLLSGR